MTINKLALITPFGVILAACGRENASDDVLMPEPEAGTGGPSVTAVTGQRLESAGGEAGNWMSHGQTYDEQRFSPLTDVHAGNVGDLGLAWYFDVPTQRGM